MMFNEKEPSIVWKEEDLIEIAHDKNAVQSSISKWSLKDDAKRAIDSNLKIEDYAFHTGLENNPWWMVDLGEIQRIEYIKIENRKHAQERLKTIRVEYSCDKKEWFFIDKSVYEWNNLDSVIIPLYSYIEARYIKVSLEERNYLHFKKIQVFKRKYPGLIVATRFDGFGGRMNAMLNAMYIAQKTGMKFGFVWNKREINANNSVFVDSEEEIFSEEFLNEYSYTDRIKHAYPTQGYRGEINSFGKTYLDSRFGFYWPFHRLFEMQTIFSDIDLKDYQERCRENALLVKWNPKIYKIKKLADRVVQEIGNFEILHLRNGDAIETFRESIFWGVVMSRVFPAEIALYYIAKAKENNKKIFLLGPDALPKELKNMNKEVYLTDDWTKDLDIQEKTMFDLFFMMRADRIITAEVSTYVECANLMSGVEFVQFSNDIPAEKQIEYFYQNHQKLTNFISPLFLAASCAFIASKLEKLQRYDEEKIILDKAFAYDKNYAYMIRVLFIFLLQKKYEECESILQFFSQDDYQKLLKTLLSQPMWNRDVNKNIIALFLSSATEKFPYISYFAAKISYYPATTSLFQKNPTNALKFIQYSLQSQPNNEEFLSCKKEIMSLLPKEETTKTIFKETSPKPIPQELEIKSLKDSLDSTKKQLESQNKFLQSQIKEINFTLHYGTAKDRIHNHLSYKLGKAMIENSKSILGYIRMPYVLSYIKEQHLKEQKQYQEKIKKNPHLKLPKLESYQDYKEALKEKECFTYQLGEALMKADKTWYKGGYIALMFEVGRLNGELAKKRKLKKRGG